MCNQIYKKKTIYVPHIGIQNITITVHSYSPLMGVHYIANTVQSDSLISAFFHFVQVAVILLWLLHTCFFQVLHTDFTFQFFNLEQNSHLFALVCEGCELAEGVATAVSGNILEITDPRLFSRQMFWSLLFRLSCNSTRLTFLMNLRCFNLFCGLWTYRTYEFTQEMFRRAKNTVRGQHRLFLETLYLLYTYYTYYTIIISTASTPPLVEL